MGTAIDDYRLFAAEKLAQKGACASRLATAKGVAPPLPNSFEERQPAMA